MVAPNGARRTQKDHPALPVTIAETVQTAAACFKAGAKGLHLHVRDERGKHTLDAGLYREALAELRVHVPGMAVQITTEAVGMYSPSEQRAVVKAVRPDSVSVSIAEMTADADAKSVINFYQSCFADGIDVQHILYSPDEVDVMHQWMRKASIPEANLQLMLVLGRYTTGQTSDPNGVQEFLKPMQHLEVDGARPDWALCAFGQQETACLAEAYRLGGKMRVGFENSLWNDDGSVAASNAERVAEVMTFCKL